jgi:glycosyltransferase
MRVLFTTFPWESHYYPIVPTQWACRAAGHDVRVATMPLLLDAVTRSGLPAVPVGPDVADLKDLFGGRSHLAGLDLTGWPIDWPVHPDRLTETQRGFLENMGVMQCVIAEAMLDDLMALCRGWQPDLIVSDAVSLAGPVVAAALGIPNVRYQWGIPYLQRIEMRLDGSGPLPEYTRLFERYGGQPRLEPDAWLDPCPPAMRYPTQDQFLPVQYVPYNGSGVVPDWLLDPPQRPRVCLTWGGTTAKSLGPAMLDSVHQSIDAVAGLDVEIVVAASPVLRDLLGELPASTRFAVSLPLQLLLPSCTAIVHHGGPGSTMTAAQCGVPQLAITRLPQLTIIGSRLPVSGAGRHLAVNDVPTGQPGVDLIRTEVATLLTDSSYQYGAQQLQQEMAKQPSPAEIVATFESLV